MQEHTRKFKIAQQQLNTKLLHQIDSLHVRRDKRRVPAPPFLLAWPAGCS